MCLPDREPAGLSDLDTFQFGSAAEESPQMGVYYHARGQSHMYRHAPLYNTDPTGPATCDSAVLCLDMLTATMFFVYVLTEMSCDGFFKSAILPYVGTYPLGLALSFFGPLVRNNWSLSSTHVHLLQLRLSVH